MLSNDRKKIILMNPVRVDYALNKYNKKSTKEMDASGVSTSGFDANTPMSWGGVVDSSSVGVDDHVWDGVPFSVQRRFRSKAMRTIVSLYIKFRLLFDKPTKDPVELFSDVKGNFKLLNNADMPDMVELLKQLERAKQAAAIRQVKAKQEVLNLEEKLITADIVQYQTEESLIQFIIKCKKGLCLTELEAFDRVIPSDVIDKIHQAEELKIFDNYYILHYDPTGAANIHYTEPEDPIADWIDEYCNLTYKDILGIGGKDFKLTAKATSE